MVDLLTKEDYLKGIETMASLAEGLEAGELQEFLEFAISDHIWTKHPNFANSVCLHSLNLEDVFDRDLAKSAIIYDIKAYIKNN